MASLFSWKKQPAPQQQFQELNLDNLPGSMPDPTKDSSGALQYFVIKQFQRQLKQLVVRLVECEISNLKQSLVKDMHASVQDELNRMSRVQLMGVQTYFNSAQRHRPASMGRRYDELRRMPTTSPRLAKAVKQVSVANTKVQEQIQELKSKLQDKYLKRGRSLSHHDSGDNLDAGIANIEIAVKQQQQPAKTSERGPDVPKLNSSPPKEGEAAADVISNSPSRASRGKFEPVVNKAIEIFKKQPGQVVYQKRRESYSKLDKRSISRSRSRPKHRNLTRFSDVQSSRSPAISTSPSQNYSPPHIPFSARKSEKKDGKPIKVYQPLATAFMNYFTGRQPMPSKEDLKREPNKLLDEVRKDFEKPKPPSPPKHNLKMRKKSKHAQGLTGPVAFGASSPRITYEKDTVKDTLQYKADEIKRLHTQRTVPEVRLTLEPKPKDQVPDITSPRPRGMTVVQALAEFKDQVSKTKDHPVEIRKSRQWDGRYYKGLKSKYQSGNRSFSQAEKAAEEYVASRHEDSAQRRRKPADRRGNGGGADDGGMYRPQPESELH